MVEEISFDEHERDLPATFTYNPQLENVEDTCELDSLEIKRRPDTLIQMMTWLERKTHANFENVRKCKLCSRCVCSQPDSRNFKLSLLQRTQNILLDEQVWLDHEKKIARCKYLFLDGWQGRLANNMSQLINNLQSNLRMCARRGGDTFRIINERYQKFIRLGFIKPVDQIPNWKELLQNCGVPGGCGVPVTVVFKSSSLSTPARPAADFKRPQNKGFSLNSQLFAGTTYFSMNEFFIKNTLFPEFACSDFATFYNTLHVEEAQWPLLMVLWSPTGSTDPKDFKLYCMVRLWYGSSCAARYTQRVKELIVAHLGLPSHVHTYVDDIGLSRPLSSQTKQLMSQYMRGFEEYGFKNKGIVYSREKAPETMADENGIVPVMGVLYNPLTDTYRHKQRPAHYQPPKTKKILAASDFYCGSNVDRLRELQRRTAHPFTAKHQLSSLMSYWFGSGGRGSPALTAMRLVMRDGLHQAKCAAARSGTLHNSPGIDYNYQLSEDLVERHLQGQALAQSYSELEFPRCQILPEEYLCPENPSFDLITYFDSSPTSSTAVSYTLHPLKTGKFRGNFCCCNCNLTRLAQNTVEGGMIYHTADKCELMAGCMAAAQAESLHVMLRPLGLRRSIIVGDSSVVIQQLVQMKMQYNQFNFPKLTYIRTIFSPEDTYFIRSKFNPADAGTRPLKSIDEIGPNSIYWKGPHWQQGEGHSIESAEAAGLIIKAANVYRLLVSTDIHVRSVNNLRAPDEAEQILMKMFAERQSEMCGNITPRPPPTPLTAPPADGDYALSLPAWEDEMTALPAAHQYPVLMSVPAPDSAVLRSRAQLITNALPADVQPVPRDFHLILLASAQDKLIPPTVGEYLVVNILARPLSLAVPAAAMFFRGLTTWFNKISRRTGRPAGTQRKFYRQNATEEGWLTDFIKTTTRLNNCSAAIHTLSEKGLLPSCPPALSTIPIYYKVPGEICTYKVYFITSVENCGEAMTATVRLGWSAYPGWGTVILPTIRQLLKKPVQVDTKLRHSFTAAANRLFNLHRNANSIGLIFTRPGLRLITRLGIKMLAEALRGCSQHIQTTLLSFANLSLFCNLSTEWGVCGLQRRADRLIHFWTDTATNIRTKYSETLQLPKYCTDLSSTAVYKQGGEPNFFKRLALKFMVKQTQLEYLPTDSKERLKLGVEKDDILVSHRRLDQNVNLAELVQPQDKAAWNALNEITLKASVPYVPRSALLLALVRHCHWSASAEAIHTCGQQTKHRSVFLDTVIARANFEGPALCRMFSQIKAGCPVCAKQKLDLVQRIYGSFKHELSSLYHPMQVVQVDLAGPFILRQPGSQTRGGPLRTRKVYCLVAVCCVTYLTKVAVMADRTLRELENALSIISHNSAAPSVIISDQEAGLTPLLSHGTFTKPDLTFANTTRCDFSWIIVAASDHRQGGMVERRIRSIKEMTGGLHLEKLAGLTDMGFYRILLYMTELMNSTPYCARLMSGPAELELLSPNSFLAKFNRHPPVSPITIKNSFNQHLNEMDNLTDQINQLYRLAFFTNDLKPKSNFFSNNETIEVGDLLAFNNPKSFKPEIKFGLVEELICGHDSVVRNVKLRIIERSKEVAGKLNVNISIRHLRDLAKIPIYSDFRSALEELSGKVRDRLYSGAIKIDNDGVITDLADGSSAPPPGPGPSDSPPPGPGPPDSPPSQASAKPPLPQRRPRRAGQHPVVPPCPAPDSQPAAEPRPPPQPLDTPGRPLPSTPISSKSPVTDPPVAKGSHKLSRVQKQILEAKNKAVQPADSPADIIALTPNEPRRSNRVQMQIAEARKRSGVSAHFVRVSCDSDPSLGQHKMIVVSPDLPPPTNLGAAISPGWAGGRRAPAATRIISGTPRKDDSAGLSAGNVPPSGICRTEITCALTATAPNFVTIIPALPAPAIVYSGGSGPGGLTAITSGAAQSHLPATPTDRPGPATSPVGATVSPVSWEPSLASTISRPPVTTNIMTVTHRLQPAVHDGLDPGEAVEVDPLVQPVRPPGLLDHLAELGFPTSPNHDVGNFAPHFWAAHETQQEFIQRLTYSFFPVPAFMLDLFTPQPTGPTSLTDIYYSLLYRPFAQSNQFYSQELAQLDSANYPRIVSGPDCRAGYEGYSWCGCNACQLARIFPAPAAVQDLPAPQHTMQIRLTNAYHTFFHAPFAQLNPPLPQSSTRFSLTNIYRTGMFDKSYCGAGRGHLWNDCLVCLLGRVLVSPARTGYIDDPYYRPESNCPDVAPAEPTPGTACTVPPHHSTHPTHFVMLELTRPCMINVYLIEKWGRSEFVLTDLARHWQGRTGTPDDAPISRPYLQTDPVRPPPPPMRVRVATDNQSGDPDSRAGVVISLTVARHANFPGQVNKYQCSVRFSASPGLGSLLRLWLAQSRSPTPVHQTARMARMNTARQSNFVRQLRLASHLLWMSVVGSALHNVFGQQAPHTDRTFPDLIFSSQKEIVAFDADGGFTGFPPRAYQFSAERVDDCPAVDSKFYPEEPFDFQALQYSQVQPAQVYQCRFQISYSVSYCSFSGIYHSLNGQVTVLPPRVAYLSSSECRMAAETGTAHIKIYTPHDGSNRQIQTQVSLTDLPHGFVTIESVAAGTVYDDASCTGSDFQFVDRTYHNSILYRSIQSTIVIHEGHVAAGRSLVMVPGLADFSLADGGVFDQSVGRVTLAIDETELEDQCGTAVELFRGQATLHRRKVPAEHMTAILFFSSGTGNQTAFVLRGELDHCNMKLHKTATQHVFIREIDEDNDYLPTREIGADDVLAVEDVRHETLSADIRLGFNIDTAVGRLEAQECQLDRRQQQNLLSILRLAGPHIATDLLQGASVTRSGAAMTLLVSHPFRARLRPYRTEEINMCIEQIPATAYASNGSRVDFFIEPVSRITTRYATRVHCGTINPVVQTFHSEATLTKLINTQQNVMQLRDFSAGPGDNATAYCDTGAGLSPCDLPPQLQPAAKPAGSDLLEGLVDSFETGEYEDSIKEYVQELARFSSHRKAVNDEFLRLTPGQPNGNTPLITRVLGDLPTKAKASFMDSVWGKLFGINYGRAFPIIAYGAMSLVGLMILVLVVGCCSESIICVTKASTSLSRALERVGRELYRLVPTTPPVSDQPEGHELQPPSIRQLPNLVAQQGQQQWAQQLDLDNLRSQVNVLRADLNQLLNK